MDESGKFYVSIIADGKPAVLAFSNEIVSQMSVLSSIIEDGTNLNNSQENPLALSFYVEREQLPSLSSWFKNKAAFTKLTEESLEPTRSVITLLVYNYLLISSNPSIMEDKEAREAVAGYPSLTATYELYEKQLSEIGRISVPDVALLFYDYVGYDCGISIIKDLSSYRMELGDWENFNRNYGIMTLPSSGRCTTEIRTTPYEIKKTILNGIFGYSDYAGADPSRSQRGELFECLTRNFFEEHIDFQSRLDFVEAIRCSDLLIAGPWTNELLLLDATQYLPNMRQDIVRSLDISGTMNDFQWDRVYVTVENVNNVVHFYIRSLGDESETMYYIFEYLEQHGMKKGEYYTPDNQVYVGRRGLIIVDMIVPHSIYEVAEKANRTDHNFVYDGNKIWGTYPFMDVIVNKNPFRYKKTYHDEKEGRPYDANFNYRKNLYAPSNYALRSSRNLLDVHPIPYEEPLEVPIHELAPVNRAYIGILTSIDFENLKLMLTIISKDGQIHKQDIYREELYSSSGKKMDIVLLRLGDIIEVTNNKYHDTIIDRSVYDKHIEKKKS